MKRVGVVLTTTGLALFGLGIILLDDPIFRLSEWSLDFQEWRAGKQLVREFEREMAA